MPAYSFHYRFSIRLPASAGAAYRWATDYRPDDHRRMGRKGSRRIVPIAADTVLLYDTQWEVRRPGDAPRKVTRTRLIRFVPDERMFTNTHYSGSRLYSQFRYKITPEGSRASRLTFDGWQVERAAKRPSAARLKALARENARHDADLWRNLVRSMAEELGPARRR
jgi:hypothetical protein